MPEVCILIPAFNEEETIGKVIDNIPFQRLKDEGYQVDVLVVNNNSTDQTARIAASKGARVITEPVPGKGKAMRKGFEATGADFVVMMDADNTYSPVYVPEILKKLHDHPVVIGSRLRGGWERGAIKPLNVVGNFLLTMLANILYQSRISDVCTGFWGIRQEVIPNLELSLNGFQFEAELFSQLAKNNYKIGEIPIYYRCRPNHPKLASVRDGAKIAWTLIAHRFHRNGK